MGMKSLGRESHGLEKLRREGQNEKNCEEQEVVILSRPGGLGALWCANRLHRQPFVSFESNKETAPLVEENMHQNWGSGVSFGPDHYVKWYAYHASTDPLS